MYDGAVFARDSAADEVSHFKKYYYHPVLSAAILFTILFGLATTSHVYQMIRTRTWFMVPFVIGSACIIPSYITPS